MAKHVERDTLSGHLAPERIDGAQVQRLVRQAIARVADEQDADAALRIALLNAGLRDIPEQPGALAMFVLSPLRNAVREFVGDKPADSMVRSLKPLLKLKSELELPKEEPDDTPSAATVLVVDADVSARAKLTRTLRDAGYNAVSAAEASVALAMCVRRKPDAVVAAAGSSDAAQLSALLIVAFGNQAPPVVAIDKPFAGDALLSSLRSIKG